MNFIQKIYFGSPGTGKSHTVDTQCLTYLGIKAKLDDGTYTFNEGREPDLIRTVFHPEYTYGDFMGKLMPLTKGGRVEYKYHAGHFMRALARAYKNKLAESKPPNNVALVIDEINRGNSAAIFGSIFQLLDRENDGSSSYTINLTEIELLKFLELVGLETKDLRTGESEYRWPGKEWVKNFSTIEDHAKSSGISIADRAIRIPGNLSIIGTMNTSDNSIYFMDSAFKRRWDWEFMDCEERTIPDANYFPEGGQLGVESITRVQWNQFVQKLNLFFKSKHQYIRGIEDKQIGRFFIKDGKIEADKLRGKLMFFVWDSVFQRDKKPLLDLLNSGLPEADKKKPSDLITFGDFCMLHNSFINAIFRFGPQA